MTAAVYRDYDQAELDAQYDNRARFADCQDYFDKWRAWSAETRERDGVSLDVAYGPGEGQTLDIFPAGKPGAPVSLFIHGGYWRSLDKRMFSFVAEGLLAHGITVAVNNYALCPAVSMDEITRQNRAALAWLHANAASFGGDPERIHVSGHSAGGQLVSMMAATDWASFDAGLPGNLLKGGCAISGLYDLEPIRLCFLNADLRMDAAEASRNSPVLLGYPAAIPVIYALGGAESDEYHRLADQMVEQWRDLGYPTEVYVPEGKTHFSIVDELRDPASPLVALQVDQIAC